MIKRVVLRLQGAPMRSLMYMRRLRSHPNEIDECIDTFVEKSITASERSALEKAIRKDMRDHLITPDEYFLYDFASKTTEEKSEFVGDMERTVLCARMYNSNPAGLVYMDKLDTYDHFSHFFKRDLIGVTSEADFEAFSTFVDKHHKYVVKPSAASRGKGIKIETAPSSDEEKRAAFQMLLESGRSVIEEIIDQSDEMAALHPESVNTIRYATFVDGGKMTTIACFVKVGRGSSIVDNGGAGGFLAAVDERTGIVTTPGRTEFGEVFEVHPDTGVAIQDYQIPAWDELLELIDRLVGVLPEQKYVGWDLAHTKSEGWVLVEGNSGGQFVGPQISMGKGIGPLIEKTFGRL